MIIYVVQYMLYSSHVTPCHILFKQNLHDTRLHPHVISMARWAPGGLRSGGATSTAALSSRYRRGGVAMWRCGAAMGFSPWKVGKLLGDPEKLEKIHRTRLGQSALGGSRAQLDFPSGFHHQSSTMLSSKPWENPRRSMIQLQLWN